MPQEPRSPGGRGDSTRRRGRLACGPEGTVKGMVTPTQRRRLLTSAMLLAVVWALMVLAGLRLAGQMPTAMLDIDSDAMAAWTVALATLVSGLQAVLIAAIMRAYVSADHQLLGCLLLIACAVVFALLAGALGGDTPTLNQLMGAAAIGLYFCAAFAQWARRYWPATAS